MSDKIVTFLGCGSWGAALGAILAEKGIFVRYWHRNESAINEMQFSRKHYLLNDIVFNENISFFPEIEWDNWISIEKRDWALAKGNGLRYRFCHFKRKN